MYGAIPVLRIVHCGLLRFLLCRKDLALYCAFAQDTAVSVGSELRCIRAGLPRVALNCVASFVLYYTLKNSDFGFPILILRTFLERFLIRMGISYV